MGAGVGISLHGDTQDPYEVTFSKPGPQDTAMSEAYPSRRATRAHSAHVSLPSAVGANAVLTVYLNGASIGAVTVPPGRSHADAVFAANSADAPCRVSVAWTTNPPASGCTVIVDLV